MNAETQMPPIVTTHCAGCNRDISVTDEVTWFGKDHMVIHDKRDCYRAVLEQAHGTPVTGPAELVLGCDKGDD